ncbi:hypothetical protein K6Q96_21730 [Grimontia kaedaensis]|uniref:DUF983 domain-containing protein n=1 Tax=Grimontia kaedaensis TaxID=2872157 RepID=A0ABY4WZG5_9GAMM|nr:hypothetical protein [Grimontia kaedaensis]USH04360.1 hypothetical protein K6Q96_21730 [Grimontia kaedaensis]
MKARCPECKTDTDTLPHTGVCSACHQFSNDWLIDDWAQFVKMKKFLMWCDAVVFLMALLSLAFCLLISSDYLVMWLVSLAIVPASLSFHTKYLAITRPDDYQGHTSKDLRSWIPLI